MPTPQKIVPHIWFDKEAVQAAQYYVSIFPASRITGATVLRDTPSGDTDIVSFVLAGYAFQAISAGPVFKLNPSVSFAVDCAAPRGGCALGKARRWRTCAHAAGRIPVQPAFFRRRAGPFWCRGNWRCRQQRRQGCRPSPLPCCSSAPMRPGRNKRSVSTLSVFTNSATGNVLRYGPGQAPDQEGTVMHADFYLQGQRFAIGDSAWPHQFAFNEAISFIVNCDSQAEIDCLLGAPFRRPGSRAVRLGEGPLWPVLADRAGGDGRDDVQRLTGADCPRHRGFPAL